ncbi:MAG: potassium channel protein [Anaerolineales bacterium]|nr:potassium channel protein [Anaerolineales bacterium]
MIDFRRRVVPVLLLPFVLLGVATAGYMLIEGWSFIDAFYMAAITMTTVGFGEVQPLSGNGRLFTIGIILIGVGVVAYGFSTILEYILTADVGEAMRRRRMSREIEKLRDHVIVCGYGRVGQSAATGLKNGTRPVVVIDKSSERLADATADGLTIIEGDASHDETLMQAGIERAWGIIICTGEDSLNLFIVLSARSLNPDLFIVTRSIDSENEPKMRRAGANRVVSPYQIGGKHMANIMTRPHVTDFFDVVTLDGGIELWVEELVIPQNSPMVGQTVGEADIRRRTGVTLVALLRDGGEQSIMPDAKTRMEVGDQLIVLGIREQLAALERLISNA